MRCPWLQAPEAPEGALAQRYYPFLDIQRGACSVKATLGPTHWSEYSQVHRGVLQLVSSLL